mmetsp:Transcript_2788/g.7321  ORF Transcript_2788/g.7321 Transcript_2788/m.7321 type:complete len:429 (-) Transcript_2788:59-1345(-)
MKSGLLSAVEGETLLRGVLASARGAPGDPSLPSLSQIADTFMLAFPAGARFRACSALVLLLNDAALQFDIDDCQRVAAYYILSVAHCSKLRPEESPLRRNPFYPLLVQLAASPATPALERAAIFRILSSGCAEAIQRSTPADFVARLSAQGEPVVSRGNAAEIARCLALPSLSTRWKHIGRGQPATPEAEASPSEAEGEEAILPPFISLPPPPLPLSPLEYKWMHPLPTQGRDGENTNAESSSSSQGSRGFADLMGRALDGPLLPSQQQELTAEIRARPACLEEGRLQPSALPALVENNPAVAVAILKKVLLLGGEPRTRDYFSVLVEMEMSFHSMEVVNTLISETQVPSEFTNLYITNCIATCQNIMDKYMQNRLIRLLCVFLQSLVRTNSVQIKDMLIEIQSFCIEFSRIKEAAQLFRVLSSYEAN